MGHRTNRTPVTVTRRAASRVRARACVVSLAPVLAALVALTAGGLGAAHIAPAQVARVVDGDTIRVRLADGARDTVRLTGVDTPETVHPTQGVEPYGPEAAAVTRARLTGATVRLVADPAGDHQDASGRLLRYVMLPSGEHVNATLIREGYATAIRTFPYSRHAECLQLEAQARAARRGQWGR